MNRLELTVPGDRYADYCLWDYQPVGPTAGRLRQASLLWHSFSVAGADARLYALCDALRAGLGPGQSVWGAKMRDGVTTWEFYFYDYARLERSVSIERVLAILAPFALCALRYSGTRPYFMFSLDLDDALVRGERGLERINVYIGNPGSSVSSGLCYGLTAATLVLDNLYSFFDATNEREAIAAKAACSAHLDLPNLDLDAILWPELMSCGVVVIANKRLCDGVYFSRIGVDRLLFFLDRLDYPTEIRDFVREERRRLSHLLFDVGIDYAVIEGRLTITKSAYYGLL
ncbi:hypothetical protein [Methylobacterium brachythecii]|uniref:Uncharacterized protein n=1 Tax=Methylobacterium brachythecii TaxID=1176177 RepID=A0A7W6F8I6_9HYPH|nr:hypothetical protein [Methylobacterium brachythecii]MBB3904445.1 hypothetical protein [Methylobacterium brachythecii]GLS43624.1 hypothetical protein GCM10007884_16090 [Methylobacterium brachythecii]